MAEYPQREYIVRETEYPLGYTKEEEVCELVRCKDCYHGSLQSNETKTYHCLKHNAMMEGHYFCNLGEREPSRQKYLICRKCGHGWFGKYNYCPTCGADMRKDGDNE